MTTLRSNGTATLLPNGQVLFVGGDLAQPATAELYDPTNQTFTPTPIPPLFFRMDQTATLMPDGKVLLGGGTDGFSGKSLETYDPVTGAFNLVGWLQEAKPSAQAALLADGRVLLTGSQGANWASSPCMAEVFDFRTGATMAIGKDPCGRGASSLLRSLDDQVWILGGGAPTTEVFNPATGMLSSGPVTPEPMGPTVQLVDGSFYSISGNRTTFFGSALRGLRLFPLTGALEPALSVSSSGGIPSLILLPTGSVLATGCSNGGQDSTLTITDNALNLAIQPAHITLMEGRSWPFLASATGGTGTPTAWSVLEPQGGSVSGEGAYTAPFTSGTFHVVASQGALSTQATIEVIPAIEVTISPSLLELVPGGQVTFTASVGGVQSPLLAWGTSGGQINASGDYTAPTTPGIYTVTATSMPDGHAATATVVVGSSGSLPTPMIQSFTTDTTIVELGQPAHLSWNVLGAYQVLLNGQDVTGLSGMVVTPTVVTTYQIEAINPAGSIYSQQIGVDVSTQPVTLTIAPTSLTTMAGMDQQVGFTLSAPTQRVIWSSSAGTITQSGLFKAPNAPGTCTITVQSVDDPSQVAICNVTVQHDFLAIQPASVTLDPGQTFRFGYQYQGPVGSPTVTWSATAGSIDQEGTYVAPAAPGSYTISLASIAEPSLVRTAAVVVAAVPIIQVLPSTVTLNTGASQTFQALARSGSVAWSVAQVGGGTITQAGGYTAPQTSGTYTVVATSMVDGVSIGTAQVIVGGLGGGGSNTGTGNAGVQITLSPASASTTSGSYFPFAALVTGSSNTAVNWAVLNLPPNTSIDNDGLFIATMPGQYTIIAKSQADSTAFVSATITVSSSISLLQANPILGQLHDYSVTALKDGRILLAGGTDYATTYSSAYIYDSVTSSFSQTGAMTRARSLHVAKLLDDGRVLIAGGVSNSRDGLHGMNAANEYWDSEVYNPETGTFAALPSVTSPYNPINQTTVSGMTRFPHWRNASVKLRSGCILLLDGGYVDFDEQNPPDRASIGSDLFNPENNTFDTGNWVGDGVPDSIFGWAAQPDCFRSAERCAAEELNDGSALISGGFVPGYAGWSMHPPTAPIWTVQKRARTYSDSNGIADAGLMNYPRAGHTMTRLADGRVLIAGGMTSISNTPLPSFNWDNPNDYKTTCLDTSSAEIYDPANGSFTATGNMSIPRREHNAILLPNGQVLIVGGINDDGQGGIAFPNTTELFDPATGTFSVMDHLDYGLKNPQLALFHDDKVFVTGQIQEPMEKPLRSQADMGGMMTTALDVGTPLHTGSTQFGVTKDFLCVVVAIWSGKSPYLGLNGSVGHVFVGKPDFSRLLSQFPFPRHVLNGNNTSLDWNDTVSEEGRLPDAVFKILLPNRSAFEAAVNASRPPYCNYWNWFPTNSNETNCLVSSVYALTMGGLPLNEMGTCVWPDDLKLMLNDLKATQGSSRAVGFPSSKWWIE